MSVMAAEQLGSLPYLRMPPVLRHGTSIFQAIFEDMWLLHLLPSFWYCNCHYYLGFSRLAFEHPTFRVRGKRSTNFATEVVLFDGTCLEIEWFCCLCLRIFNVIHIYVRTIESILLKMRNPVTMQGVSYKNIPRCLHAVSEIVNSISLERWYPFQFKQSGHVS